MNATRSTPSDIDERALQYGVRAVTLYRYLQRKRDGAGWIIGKQFLRSATSIGASLAEARSGETRADFIHKCSIAQKEARESQYWLKLMLAAEVLPQSRLESLIQETNELIAIITAIARNAKAQSV